MDKEIWKDIPDFEGLYQVSNLGRVKSLERKLNTSRFYKKGHITHVKILKPRLCGKGRYKGKGYYRVALYKNSKRKDYFIHRLVLTAFVGDSDLTVNHKDENTTNNRLDNLEYLTNTENMQYSRNKAIIQYDIDNNKIKEWASITDAQRTLKISHISQACRGKRNIAGGFIWKFKEEKNDKTI